MDGDTRPAWDSLSEDELLEACAALLRRAAARLGTGTLDPAVMEELREALSLAQKRLPGQKLEAMKNDLERAQDHFSLWLFYHDMRIQPDLSWKGPHGISSAATAGERAIAEEVARTMKRAYWDSACADLDGDPPKYDFVLDRLRELVDTLVGFVPAPRRDAKRAEAMDYAEVLQLVEHQALDWRAFLGIIQRIAHVLVQLESPYESERTERWIAGLHAADPPGDAPGFNRRIVEALAHLFEKCDLIQVGIQNARLRCVQAEDRRELERLQFARMLDSGAVEFAETERWLRASGDPRLDVAFYRGVARLLQGGPALDQESCPEALRCDLGRLHGFQRDLRAAALVGLVAIATHGLLPPAAQMADVEPMLDRVWDVATGPRPSADALGGAVGDQLSEIRRRAGLAPPEALDLDRALSQLRGCFTQPGTTGGSGAAAAPAPVAASPALDLLHSRALAALTLGLGPPRQALPRECLGASPWPLHAAVKRLEVVVGEIWDFASDHLAVYRPMYQLALDEAAAAGPAQPHAGAP